MRPYDDELSARCEREAEIFREQQEDQADFEEMMEEYK